MNDKINPQPNRSTMSELYESIRAFSLALCEPLQIEDYIPQSMAEASPTRWHIAHTTWFFEQFILFNFISNYELVNPNYNFLFNSYYNAVGERAARHQRGLMTRPTLKEVLDYREIINSRMQNLIHEIDGSKLRELENLMMVGLNHEQQHQELMLTDIKHLYYLNHMHPEYSNAADEEKSDELVALTFTDQREAVYSLGYTGNQFSYDNELPRHKVFLQAYRFANRLVTNAEYLVFMADGGYVKPEFWLDDGWAILNREAWEAPLYWFRKNGYWYDFTLNGVKPLRMNEPVCHVSFYEADAYARWADLRLPTEAEWEIACQKLSMEGNFVNNGRFHPLSLIKKSTTDNQIRQAFGDLWEWTASPYRPYPGYQAVGGAIGEYNGKFMSNQFVMRGGSCATSQNHIRPTYRNFFHPHARWQFSGIRLANEG